MAGNVSVKNPIEIRKAGLRALNKALGYEGTQIFMTQSFGGTGDYTKEKYELEEPSFEELTAELWRVDAEMRVAGEYDE